MRRKCPDCGSHNVRRTSTPLQEVTWRNQVYSRYLCRDCETRFWVISRKTYMVAAGIVTMIVVAVIAGILLEMWMTDELSPPKKRPRRVDVEQMERVPVAAGASAIVRLGAPQGKRDGPSPAGVAAPV